jgi:hypothetical protein
MAAGYGKRFGEGPVSGLELAKEYVVEKCDAAHAWGPRSRLS